MQVVASIKYDRGRPIGVGQGQNSSVFFATDPQLGGSLAVKEIPKRSFGNDPSAYFTEAQAMFRASHQNIVAVQYACETDDYICLAMPYCANGSLAERIKDRPLPLGEFLRLAQDVLTGLAHIHRVGDVHLDVQSRNVLYSDAGVPMISDFGQARSLKNGVASIDRIDAWVVPPETATSFVATVASDIYQAGLLFYEALNGADFCQTRRPAVSEVRELIKRGKFPNRQQFLPHVPRHLRTLVRKALEVQPGKRFQSSIEFADALSRVQLDLDWKMQPHPNGGRLWVASRPACADLVVEQVANGAGYDIRTHTEKNGEPRRAKEKGANWRSGVSDRDALDHLKKVFERLP